ncbi:MAG: SDR family NAD(P)-dependent oxidoreductase [Sphingomonas sp.]|uniref:type I polyketide synthase n=1 Tax=Sphingomonas sp. TaxID=28214 RepID=UPI001B269CF9|nr:type I polyketide synthase [Sphingomonas sp.]MBO9623884.1 SDR family NAD(P)-dependent oxidoreductase [Sphingomonas sp.]
MYQYRSEFGASDESAHPDTAIAVVGMSCRFAGARDLEAYWALLQRGEEAIRTYSDDELIAAGVRPEVLSKPDYVRRGAPLEDMEYFDASLFGLSPRDAAIMDPQHRHFLECAWEALENAGHVPQRFGGAIGVFAGSGHNAYMPYHLLTNPKLVRDVGLFLLRHTSNDKDFLATRVSYLLDLKGPSINVQTACSTSLVSIHMAAQSLLNGECDMALAGGVSIELPHRQGYLFEKGGILSSDGHCRPFDAGSKGTVFGSGAAVVVLRRLADAVASRDHIYAVIRGSAINNDGAGKVGYLAPSVDGQAQVIAEALAISDVPADTVSYVEAHGTGTPVGDPIELAALTQAFRESTDRSGFCAIGSAKGNIGHTDTAAGAAGLIKVAMALSRRELPPSLNFDAPNPECAFERSPFFVQADRRAWEPQGHPRRAGVSSLGVGGTNAHAVLEEAPERLPGSASRRQQLLLCSARSERALRDNCIALGDHFGANSSDDLPDAAFTLSTGRRHLPYRCAVLAETSEEAAGKFNAAAAVAEPSSGCMAERQVAFLFCGAGSQHADMALELYRSESVFRTVADEGLTILDGLGLSQVRRWLLPTPEDRAQAAVEMERPSIALPALFIVQVALARLWMSLGVRPSGMIGHSSGEYAAAHLAGVIDMEAGLRIVSARGRLFETVEHGGMLSIAMAEAELKPLLPAELSIAAINAPNLCVVSGPAEAVTHFRAELAAREIDAQVVRIAVAAHSPVLDPILPEFRALMRSISLRAPRLPFVSNLTGDWIAEHEATDPEYWVRHLRETVRFTDGLQQLLIDSDRVLLEVGPGRSMASLARQHPHRARTQAVLSSLPHPEQPIPGDSFFWTSVGQLWELGVPLDWDGWWAQEARNRVPLPTYRFERQRHWFECGSPSALVCDDADSLERRPELSDWLFEPVWTRAPAAGGAAVSGNVLVFQDRGRFGEALAQQLRASGAEVISVFPGDRFRRSGERFTVDPGSPADYAALFEQLRALGTRIGRIYHCWLADGGRRASRPVDWVLERGFHSLVAMAPVIAREIGDDPIDMAVVTAALHRVADDRTVVPEKATALGAASVIAAEYPNIRVRSIDVPLVQGAASRRLSQIAEAVASELSNPPTLAPIAIRGGERWLQSYRPVAGGTAEPALQSRLCCGATYLITGGLGGLGLTIARHLAQQYSANVALIARSPLPPRHQWADLLANNALDPKTAERVRKLLAIEAAGGKVELFVADLTDARAVGRAVRQVRARFGRIRGVFHAAGTLDDALIETGTRGAIEAVLRPKVAGTHILDAALATDRPEFLLLFSSVSAFAGLPGQAGYAAANAFLDSFAQARHEDPATRVISVAWSQWREVGMAAALSASADGICNTEQDRIGEEVHHPFLDRLHAVSEDEYVVTGSLSPERHWLLGEHRVSGGALIPGTGYLELARAAFDLIDPGPAILSDVTFLSPFSVADGEERHLRVHLRRRVGRDWRFTISGRGLAEPAWSEHATGTIRMSAETSEAAIDIPAISARCLTTRAGNREQSHVLDFGPRWHNVRRTELGEDEAVLHLELDAAFHGDVDVIRLHPALLDLATAGAQALIPGYDAKRDFFAPFSYRRIMLHRPLPARIVSHIRYRRPTNGETQTATFDVIVTNEGGDVLVDASEFMMVRVRDAALLSGVQPLALDSKAEEKKGLRPQLDGILPEEGVAVLEHVLSRDLRPHTIVSPYPLEPALALLRKPRPLGIAGASRGEGSAEDLPRTPMEQSIADLWGDLLGLDCVRRTDNFFDLGGHSLLAVQFTNRLRKKTGKSLPLAALLDRPTVENLARALDPNGAETPSERGGDDPAPGLPQVTSIRPGGARAPIFFVHDGLGETLLYRGLALRLNPERAIYGLEPLRGATGFAHTRIDEMAANYVERVRALQPHGPYLLAGLCAGGVIAFEMARQLEEIGERVAFVGIIDAADVASAKRSFVATRARLNRVRMLFAQRKSLLVLPALVRRAINAAAWELGSRLRRARDRQAVQQLRRANHAVAAPPTSSSAPGISFLKLYEVAHARHRPAGLFGGGTVVLFMATSGNGTVDDAPYGEIYSDSALGWGRRVAGEVSVIPVPGGHSSALQEPNVEVLALRFQEAVDAAMDGLDADTGVHLPYAPACAVAAE